MNTQEITKLFEKYVVPNYTRNPVAIARGSGSEFWDAEGKRYLDMFPGWATTSLGHCHPKVVAALQRQAATLLHVPNVFYIEQQGRLAQLISERSFHGQCFFCNSGAEANEAAIKLARIASGPGRYKIITMENSFHGRTLAAISATAQPKYHKGFEPIVQGFTYVPFNDLEAVRRAIEPETCGVMFEPIQGEGGINIATPEYMQGLRRLCDERKLLMILDEVQTGMGRTGRWFAYQHYGIEPDIMTLAKALGAGAAIGAMEAKKEIAQSLKPGTHASTFGGNPLACSAGIAVFEVIESEGLLQKAKEMGEYAMNQLRSLRDGVNFVSEVRGVGLMVGVQLTVPGSEIAAECLRRGLYINCTHDKVLRFMPAMTVTKAQVDEAIAILRGVMVDHAKKGAKN
jgi:acetylornithine/N-succinyldiaminopimelate aminotransferase